MKIWNAMPEWARWLLYLPAVIGASSLFALFVTAMVERSYPNWRFFAFLMEIVKSSAHGAIIILLGAMLAPRWKTKLMFAWVVLYASMCVTVIFVSVLNINKTGAIKLIILSLASICAVFATAYGLYREKLDESHETP